MLELEKKRYQELIPTLRTADINTMFAMSVLEGKVVGKVFIDDVDFPASFYVQHSYGMSLLYGENGKEAFFQSLKTYFLNDSKTARKAEWLQVYPALLYPKLDKLFGNDLIKKGPEEVFCEPSNTENNKILEYQRINFIFCKEKFEVMKKKYIDHINMDTKIVPTTEEIFNRLNGNVVPKYFWNSFSDFNKYGIGFTLLSHHSVPASTAFASFVIDNKLEIGIETDVIYRGSGFAARVSIQLIEYCLSNGLEPVWSCNSGNIGSRKLAQSLGFEECKRIPYYHIPSYQSCN